MQLYQLGAEEISAAVKNKELSVTEVTEYFADRTAKYNTQVNAAVNTDTESAMAQAEELQKQMEKGEVLSPLAGVPALIKDNIVTKGMETTCGSKILKGFIPPYDSTVSLLLKSKGTVIIGKANMDEFAMGSTSETSCFGAVHNPHNLNHVAGGSSGGSAAAVACGMVPFALGSDTGGSVRQPAAYCGVTGFKPSYGAVSRYGLIAYGSSLDQIGPLAKSVKDCAAVMDLIGGYDEKDSTSSFDAPTGYAEALQKGDIKGFKIGVPDSYFGEGLNPEVKDKLNEALKVYEALGAEIEEFSLPVLRYAVPAYYIIATAEASSNLSRFDGVKYGFRSENGEGLKDIYLKTRTEGFGSEVKKRIMLGSFVLSSGYYDAYYNKALKVKNIIKQSFDEAFAKYDCVFGPVAPFTAPVLGDSLKDPLAMYLSDIYTVSANLVGIPGLTIPCGFDSSGLPVAFQLLGKAFDDKKLLVMGDAYQKAVNYKYEIPSAFREEN